MACDFTHLKKKHDDLSSFMATNEEEARAAREERAMACSDVRALKKQLETLEASKQVLPFCFFAFSVRPC